GGTLGPSGSGAIRFDTSAGSVGLLNTANTGSIIVGGGGSGVAFLSGSVNNAGSIEAGTGAGTATVLNTGSTLTTLSGGGALKLANASLVPFIFTGSSPSITNTGHTIHGWGTIGLDHPAFLLSNGTAAIINADEPGRRLTL